MQKAIFEFIKKAKWSDNETRSTLLSMSYKTKMKFLKYFVCVSCTPSCWVQGEQRRSESKTFQKAPAWKVAVSWRTQSIKLGASMFQAFGHRPFLSELPKEKIIIMLRSEDCGARLNYLRVLNTLLSKWISRSAHTMMQQSLRKCFNWIIMTVFFFLQTSENQNKIIQVF